MGFISQEEANEFFDQISKTKKIDMFNAPLVLCDNFGIDKRTANNLFLNWVEANSLKNKKNNG